jgi:putative phosphoesterase
MKIGVLSDTHNNLTNLQSVLIAFRAESITTLFHCGDLTTPETAASLGGFRVIHVAGNGDFLSGEIRRVLLDLNQLSSSAPLYSGQIDGVSIAAVHGHQPHQLEELVASGRFQYVLHGHSHHRHSETVGKTRIINPGSLGGMKPEERSACILDLARGQIRFIFV